VARDPESGHRSLSVRAAVVVFALTAVAAVLVIAIAVLWVARREATDEAVRAARDVAVTEAQVGVAPVLTDGLSAHDPAAVRSLDSVVRQRVLSDRVVRIKVWSPDGTILYSDEPELIGRQFDLAPSERVLLETGQSAAHVSDLGEPENEFERSFGKLLEVYVGVRTPSGQPLLYESYLRFSSVDTAANRTLTGVLPALVGGLALLLLIQIPLAWSLARRVERSRAEERRLLRSAVDAGDVERRHLAADLHDGVVQSLVGTSLSLTASADEAARAGLPAVADRLNQAADDLRQGVRDLRSLIVAIAPPRLHDEGLAVALRDLVSPLRTKGIKTELRVDEDLTLPPGTETLLYRSAQEALRNVTRHANANTVDVTVQRSNGVVRLEVADDGVGFTTATTNERRAAGHVGLHLLGELVAEAGGQFEVISAPGDGTRVCLEVPWT